MPPNILQRILSAFRSKPSPQFIARQLRKPSGEFAEEVAARMNQVNAPLYDLTLETMQLNNQESVLEIGFGSGKFFPRILQEAEELQISGIDYSNEMVEGARALNEALITSNRLKINQANSNNIPFSDDSFHKVFCNMVIYFWDKPDEHLKEIRRVLKPGGRFYTGMRSKDSMQVFPFIEHGFQMYDQSRWRSILQANGFNMIQTKVQKDPELHLDGRVIRLESICIEAGNGM